MEWIDGPTLAQLVQRDGPLESTRAAQVGAQIAEALVYAHGHGVIHRDVKPSNVLFAPSGHVKVTDFGIAKVAERSLGTEPGVILGTPNYLSPEQIEGHPADARSDIYALGAVLYMMVTSQPPFVADTPAEVAAMHLNRRPVRPSAVNPDVAPALEAVLSRALARDPVERYATAQALEDALFGIVEAAPQELAADDLDATMAMPAMTAPVAPAAPESTRVLAAPPPVIARRRPWPWIWALVALLAVAVAVLAVLVASGGGGGTGNVTVPDVRNLPQDVATTRLRAAHLQASPTAQQNSDTVAAGSVIDQDPKPGQRVPKNSTVSL